MRVLITGANGLLGQKTVAYCIQNNIEFLATSQGKNRNSNVGVTRYAELDITSNEQIESLVALFKPTTILNTAAITNVDLCEIKKELCDEVNVYSVSKLLAVCAQNKIHLIHLSTDFVFDGENGPYKEEDARNPLSYYGASKVQSENILINSKYKNWSIVRTIIVFGVGENMSRSNIVLWAKSALEAGQELTIVDDQFRAPTFAEDLAEACMKIAESRKFGIYHISGPQTFSILELVKRVGVFFKININKVKPIKSASLGQAAKRPARTGFVLEKAKKEIAYNPLKFEESLEILARQLETN